MTVKKPSTLLFSGGFGPMGYGIPGAIGASLANLENNVIAVVGDGDFQMTLQELATIYELNLPIIICIINNNSLRIIQQWQEMIYGESYQVKLENPDFVKLANSYHIEGECVNSPGKVIMAVQKALKMNKPYLIDIEVDEEEGIPLPEVLK
jgi:acetolactate synthase-1/2/3 large subunit